MSVPILPPINRDTNSVVTKTRNRYYIVMHWQCDDLPSYWIRQVRHTNASNPDALTERKNKCCDSFSVRYVSHTCIRSPPFIFLVWGMRFVSVVVCIFCFFLFSSWGNLPLQSYWSLSCDHGLHCSDDSMCCLLILLITQSGSWTLRPPRLLLSCFPLFRRHILSDITYSPLSSTATKT